MPTSLHDFLTASAAADTVEQLYAAFLEYLRPLGVEAVSYHLLRSEFDAPDFETSLNLCTFPDDWVEHYKAADYFADDPIMAHALRGPLPFHWFEVEETDALTPAQQALFDDLREAGFSDGIGVPIFGPSGRAAYFGLGCKGGQLDVSKVQIREIQYACHQVHVRVMEFTRRLRPSGPALSAREREVMQWVARGKSNSVIADILGVSSHTVDTVMRRAFAKLNAANRISAVLKAAAAGLITP